MTIPKILAAQVMYESNRTCCVCQRKDKPPLQIHHIDEDPSNNVFENLAVLCFECHDLTQVRGGFARKLDAEQVILYRRGWLSRVRVFRESFAQDHDAFEGLSDSQEAAEKRIRRVMLMVELARDDNDWYRAASLYDMIGEKDLRDKYIEMALPDATPYYQVLLTNMQGRAHELAEEVKQAALDDTVNDRVNQFSVLADIGRTEEASLVALSMANKSIEDGRLFAAAYTIKNRLLPMARKLFLKAFDEFEAQDDLWWQLRCFDELGWHDAARELILGNETRIRESDNFLLQQRLAAEKGDEQEYAEVARSIDRTNNGAYIVLSRKPTP